jgi:hypothetical protein
MGEIPVAPKRYIRNPDVVLREEDAEGGLLFNPDTNQIKVLNETGLFIWQLCDGSRDLTAILIAIHESFDEVPEEQITEQVTGFIDYLTATGFVGIVEDNAE